MNSQSRTVTENKAEADHSAGNIMSSSTHSSFLLLLAKLVDKDPNYRRSSMEAIKELMQREILHELNDVSPFIDTLLGTLDKKSKHYLVSSADQSSYSHLVQSLALLFAEMASHATQQSFKLGLQQIASIVKHLVSWFRVDKSSSQSHSLIHQACAKLVCSLAENVALVEYDSHSESSTNASGSSTINQNYLDSTGFSDSLSYNDEDLSEQVSYGIESLCRPLTAALCSTVEPTSRGATICLEALVSKDVWRFASPSLIEELCFKAVNAMQERTALSASTAQMSLLCNLAKRNQESLSLFRAGLLKKGADILLNSGEWQQRVAAARLIECLLSMGDHTSLRSGHDKKAVMQAIESMERCRLDKAVMVRSAVGEALKKAKEQGVEEGSATTFPGMASTSSLSPVNATKADYRKRRRKKPSSCERPPAFLSPTLIRSDPFYVNDRWINKVTPSSGWSSSDSVNSSIDVKCPRKKVAKTGAWNGKKGLTIGENEPAIILSLPSSPSISSSLSPTSAAPSSAADASLSSCLSSSSTSIVPSSTSNISCNTTDKMNSKPSLHPRREEITKNGSPKPHKLMGSLIMEPILPQKLEKGGMEESISASCSSEEDVCSIRMNYACGTEQECSLCATPTYIHHNPIAQFESLEEVEGHNQEEVEGHNQICKPATKPSEGFLSTTPISLLLPKLEQVQLQHTGVANGMKRNELVIDSAWNVRNNPMATDDSELDSPRPTVFDSYSIIYCDDGDDDDDVNVQQRHPDCDVDPLLHARPRQVGDDFADERKHRQYEDVEGDGGLVDQGSTDDDKKQAVDSLEDHAVDNNCRPDAHDLDGGVDIAEKRYGQDNFASLPTKKDAEASLAKYQANVFVSKEMLMEGGESRKKEDMCDVSTGLDLSACKSAPKTYCNACHCLLQDFSVENSSFLKEHDLHLMSSYSTVSRQDVGGGHAAIGNEKDHMSRQPEHCNQADPHSLVANNEHEGVVDNFSHGLACLNATHQVHRNKAAWEESATDECLNVTHQALSHRNKATQEESATDECPGGGHQLDHIITEVKDMQATIKPAIAMEASEAGSLQTTFGEEDDSRGDSEVENGNSVLGWLRKCYVVKKFGAFGAFFLVVTIPVAIVCMLNSFEDKEEGTDFLVPT